MFDFIRNHQMNIMLILTAICMLMAFMLLITRFLPKRRKWILIVLELIAAGLIGFDRLTYIYNGDNSSFGYVMTRLSNFLVFSLTSGIVLCFNYYLEDLLASQKIRVHFKRLTVVKIATIVEILLVVINLFTGGYYSFTEENVYFRGSFFLICYIVPVVCPIIQLSVILKYRKSFSRFIYMAMFIYIVVPIVVGIIQIFTYGLSIVNMAIVLSSITMYFFTYLDINDEVIKAHNLELFSLKAEQRMMKDLFGQTAEAFTKAVEECDAKSKGKAKKAADIARKIAEESGKSKDECEEVYYAALLHKVASEEVLNGIKDYPYLAETARYCKDRYDGKDNKSGLVGDEIPEIARIVAVADAWCFYTEENKERKAIPNVVIREEFLKEAGAKFDPHFSKVMVHLMDIQTFGQISAIEDKLETELSCSNYRENVSVGIPVSRNITKISFKSKILKENETEATFSAPSLVIFDSFDKHVYETEKLIESYRYVEYGELWFDGHSISTNARNIEVKVKEKNGSDKWNNPEGLYTIISGRYEDHLKLDLETENKIVSVVIALSDSSKSVYIGLTGENCQLSDIKVEETDKQYGENDIPRISEKVSYIDRIEADIPNIQINSPCGVYTDGIKIKENMTLAFHTMSFPESSFVWHCPSIVLFYSEDGKVGGPGYREYAFIKLDGEDNGSNDYAENHFSMNKKSAFQDWSEWKNFNKAGFDCEIEFQKKDKTVVFHTENYGINIKNTTTILDENNLIYVALTGDQCAITDIRMR